MMKRNLLCVLFASLLLIGCGTVNIEGRLVTPAEATVTAQAALTAAPTPTPELGKLAYVQGGDVWVEKLPDGAPQRLTTDGRNRDPRWSPSGEWLAFRKGDYQVWVMYAASGEGRPLNDGAAVDAFAWAPATDRLAYVAGGNELRVIDADGDEPATLVPQAPAGQIGQIAWSPDGTGVAYEWREEKASGPPARSLWKVSADGDEPAQLYPDGHADIGGPILHGSTGDGRFLLVQSDMNSASLLADGAPLYALPADGGSFVQLEESVLAYADFVVPQPAPTDQVAVVAGGGRNAWENKRLHIVQAATGESTPLTSSDLAVSSPAWSPDGRRIAYVAMPQVEGVAGGDPAHQALMQRRIWVMNVEDGQNQQLTEDPAYRDERPLWSADGSHILFARLSQDDRASLWLMPAEGGEPTQVVGELTPAPGWFGYYGHIDWDVLFDWWRGENRMAQN